jgi:hypothetical protein
MKLFYVTAFFLIGLVVNSFGQDEPDFMYCDQGNLFGGIVPGGANPCDMGPAIGNSIKSGRDFDPNVYGCASIIAGYRPFQGRPKLPALTIGGEKTVIYFTNSQYTNGEFENVEVCRTHINNNFYDVSGLLLTGYIDEQTSIGTERKGFVMKTDKNGVVQWLRLVPDAIKLVDVEQITFPGTPYDEHIVAVGQGWNNHAIVVSLDPSGTTNFARYYRNFIPTGAGNNILANSKAQAVDWHIVTNSAGNTYPEIVVLIASIDGTNGRTSHLMPLHATTGGIDLQRPYPFKHIIPNCYATDFKIFRALEETKDRFFLVGHEFNNCAMIYADIDETGGSLSYDIKRIIDPAKPNECFEGGILEQYANKVYVGTNYGDFSVGQDILLMESSLPVASFMAKKLTNSNGNSKSHQQINSIDYPHDVLGMFTITTGFTNESGVITPFVANFRNTRPVVGNQQIFCDQSMQLTSTAIQSGGQPSYGGFSIPVLSASIQTISCSTVIDEFGCTPPPPENMAGNGEDDESDFNLKKSFKAMDNKGLINVNVYPNPVSGMLNVEVLESAENLKVELKGLNGQVFYSSREVLLKNGKFSIDMQDYKKGVYFLEFKSENYVSTRKIVKQ